MKPLNRFQKVRPHRACQFGPFKCTYTTYHRLNCFFEKLEYMTRFVLGIIAVCSTGVVLLSLFSINFGLAILALCIGIIALTLILPD